MVEMNGSELITLVSALLSAIAILAVATIGILSRQKETQQTAAEAVRLVAEPLSYATSDLQSRLWNLARGQVKAIHDEGKEHEKEYVYLNTLFVFAQFFAWSEMLRLKAMLSSASATHTVELRRSLNAVMAAAASAPYGDGAFLVLPGDQRAIGEQLLSSRVDSATGSAVIGFATFTELYKQDANLQGRLASVRVGIDEIIMSESTPVRLIAIQNALIAVIETLDPKALYTPLDERGLLRS